jgi:hypothetical protein
MKRYVIVGLALVVATGIAIAIYAGSTTVEPTSQSTARSDGKQVPDAPSPPRIVAPTEPVNDPKRRAELARAIAEAHVGDRKLTKEQVRLPLKRVMSILQPCFVGAPGGVLNIELAIDSARGVGAVLTVRGFDASGPVVRALEVRECVSSTMQAIVLPPIADGGRIELTYPLTLAARPPDNRDTRLVDEADRAIGDGQWTRALVAAERGLEQTSLDGTFRRRLIEIAGLAACNLKDEAKARRYLALASPEVEPKLRETCLRVARIQ